jgi:predicted transcriptional regulator
LAEKSKDAAAGIAPSAPGVCAMNLADIIRVVDGKVLTSQVDLDLEINYAVGCDLMSDVLAFARPYALLLTGLTNIHVIRTAEMADVAGIVFVRGKQPEADVIAMAEEKAIPLISSTFPMFDICAELHAAGLTSCEASL